MNPKIELPGSERADDDDVMVRRLAGKLQRELGLSSAVLDDLVQCGYIGLLEARGRFDAERGTDFRWFAHRRIQGAMLDGLRKMTRLPRRAHQLLRLAELAQDDAMQFGDSLEDALDAGRLIAQGGFLVVHTPYPVELTGEAASPEDLSGEKQQVERVRLTIDALAEPDREIARRRILDGEPLTAIAADMGISRPWAWRVLERACRTLSERVLAAAHEKS